MEMLTVYCIMGIEVMIIGAIVGKTIATISNLISKYWKVR